MASDKPLSEDGVTVDQDSWRIERREGGTVRLFELPVSGVEQCILTYRARLKAAGVEGGAYLEMWCRLPGRGEFFSKAFHQKAQGTVDWASYEVPFYLKKGQCPDLIKLNLVFDGGGTVWIKEVELLQTPLK